MAGDMYWIKKLRGGGVKDGLGFRDIKLFVL